MVAVVVVSVVPVPGSGVSPRAGKVIEDAGSMRVRGLCAWAVGVAIASATLVGCTGDDSADDTGPTTSTGATITLTQPSAPLKVVIAQLGGGVKKQDYPTIKQALAKPIGAWVDGGFLDPQYPAADFGAAFASWTPDARRLAQRDRDITTNAALGDKLIAVVADAQSATLYVFASHGRTGGATARVRLRFTGELSDQSLVHFVVHGELYLTRKGSQWQIFGYRLSREVVA
jgi:hypothetical protein